MPRRFHDAEELFPPATVLKRALAIIYDGLISIAVLLVATWAYTMVAGWVTGWDRYEQMAEAGQLSGDPGLTFTLFLVLYLFFGYFWTRIGQTLGMQVWRIRIENIDGTLQSFLDRPKTDLTTLRTGGNRQHRVRTASAGLSTRGCLLPGSARRAIAPPGVRRGFRSQRSRRRCRGLWRYH